MMTPSPLPASDIPFQGHGWWALWSEILIPAGGAVATLVLSLAAFWLSYRVFSDDRERQRSAELQRRRAARGLFADRLRDYETLVREAPPAGFDGLPGRPLLDAERRLRTDAELLQEPGTSQLIDLVTATIHHLPQDSDSPVQRAASKAASSKYRFQVSEHIKSWVADPKKFLANANPDRSRQG